jgi:ribosomal protein S18 acetylase RimI-like enzyme
LESHLRNGGCLVAQVVVATRDPRQEIRLQQLGFQYLAQLVYMYQLAAADPMPADNSRSSIASVSQEAKAPDAAIVSGTRSEGELCFVPSCERSGADLHDVVERTYTGSRDCPAVDGVRTTEDVLDGYRHTGRFSPDHWFLIECHGQTVGCLLLTEHSEHQWELIYMGVVPTSRGRGWGERIARFAWRHVRSRGGEQLVLAVDADNEPARAMYRRAGFADWAHRHVYFKPLSTAMPSA